MRSVKTGREAFRGSRNRHHDLVKGEEEEWSEDESSGHTCEGAGMLF